jgi:hypothetical protein
MPRPCRSSSTSQGHGKVRYGHGMALLISIGCPETACGRPARVRFIPATTRCFTKGVIRDIPIHETVGLAVRIFPATTRTFTKEMALSGMTGARHGMCELTRHGMAEKRHGRNMGAAWHGRGTA